MENARAFSNRWQLFLTLRVIRFTSSKVERLIIVLNRYEIIPEPEIETRHNLLKFNPFYQK